MGEKHEGARCITKTRKYAGSGTPLTSNNEEETRTHSRSGKKVRWIIFLLSTKKTLDGSSSKCQGTHHSYESKAT
eukprot:1140355-Pelagomonas_calceolata.AAC.4